MQRFSSEMADQHDGNASDDNTIIRSHRSSHPSVNARDLDEEIMPRALFLNFRDNNHHLDLESPFGHRIIIEIIRGHPICTALTRVELVPAIYLQQFWHTLQFHPTARPPQFTARIDHFDVRITLRGIRRALNLPHHDNFEDPAPEVQLFEDIRSLGYQDPRIPVLTGSSQFRRKHLPPIWYTLCSILNRCMTSKHTGIDKTNLPILRMFHAFTFNLNIDYVVLIWNEMIDLVADKARPLKDRNFVPFQRFFQILIHQAMEDNSDIPRREDAPRGPTQWMHRLVIPNYNPFAHIAVIREDVLNYVDQQSWVVIQYRIENALVVQPDPAGPVQDANPLGGEGPNVEGVQEQRVPEQREVRRTVRKRVGGSIRINGHASSSHLAQRPPRSRRAPVRDNVEEPISQPLNTNDDDDDSDHDTMAHLIPRHVGKRQRVECSNAESTRHIEHLDTTTDAAGPSNLIEGGEAVGENIGSGEDRGRKEMSENVIESDKVLTTDSPQTDPSRVATSSTNVRSSPLHIESASVDPAEQCTPPPSHSSFSQQAGVSFSTGELAQTLSATHSVFAGIETGRLLPRPPPFFESTSSLVPFGTTFIPRTRAPVQHHVEGFRAPTETSRVLSPFVGASRGPGGRPINVNTMPALNIGHTVSSTVMSTSNLSGLGVSPEQAQQIRSLIGPPPHNFVPVKLKLPIKSLSNSYKAHETEMKEEMRKLSQEVSRAVKGKGVAESPSSPPVIQPSRTESDTQTPPSVPLHLIPEDQLKSELLARLLAKSDTNTAEEVYLISLLRQQTQPQASTSTDTQLLLGSQLQKLTDSISDMTNAILAGFQSLATRVTVVEEACGIQAETSQKRRHDDQDANHPERERRAGGVGSSAAASTGNVVETGTEKTTGTGTEGNTGTGATDTEMVQAEEVNVLADVIAGVEKPSASDNRTEVERFSDDVPIDIIHIDSDEEPERTTIQIKQEIEDVFDISGTIMAAPGSDNEAPAKTSQPQAQTDQTACTSAPTTPVIQPIAPVIRLQADGKIRDPILEAELRHFQETMTSQGTWPHVNVSEFRFLPGKLKEKSVC